MQGKVPADGTNKGKMTVCVSPFAGLSPIPSSSHKNNAATFSLLDQRLHTIISQQSIEGMLGVYTNSKAEAIDTNEFRHPGAPMVEHSLCCEVVSHMYEGDEHGLSHPPLELDEITAGPSQIAAMKVEVECPSRHLKHPSLPTMAPSGESPSVHLTDVVPQNVSTHVPRKKKAVPRPIPKRVLRVEEARRTMSPEEFVKWRTYREKNNRSVQMSRQRKRDAKKEAERLRSKNLALSEKISSLELTTSRYMDMLANNAT